MAVIKESVLSALDYLLNTLRQRHHFADDIYKRIFLNESVWISIKSWQKFVLKVKISNLFQHWLG